MSSRPPPSAAVAAAARITTVQSRQMTTAQSALVGGLAGVVEVAVNQPTVAWKNALQQSRRLILTPRELYRGVGINAASIAPITAVQFGANALILRALPTDTPHSPAVTIGAGFAAGACSALFSTPAELVMIRQQRRQAPFLVTAREALSKTPLRGFWLGAARDGIFTAGYLGIGPVFSDIVASSLGTRDGPPPAWARYSGSAAAGVLAGTLSHCFDTMKTAVQGAEKGEPWRTIPATRALMEKGGGLKALYSGLIPRGLRITIGCVVLQECKVQFGHLLFPAKE